MSVLHELLAAGSHSPSRIVMVPLAAWSEALTAARPPRNPRGAQLLADLIEGSANVRGKVEVGIQANHLQAVLGMLPPDFEPARAESFLDE